MAGTRLLIQGLVVLELLALTVWSLYYGLCYCNDDVLCQRFWHLMNPPKNRMPELSIASFLPEEFAIVAQVVSSQPNSIDNLPLTCHVHPHAATVCQDPEASIVSNHPLWICLDAPEPKLVVRQESLIVHATTISQLESLLFPKEIDSVKLSSPQVLNLHLVVEEEEEEASTTTTTKYWAQLLEDWIESSRLDDWPNVQDIEVSIQMVPSRSHEWVIRTIPSQEDGKNESSLEENSILMLPKLTASQVDSLVPRVFPKDRNANDDDRLHLVFYIPSILPQEEKASVWKRKDEQQLWVVPSEKEEIPWFAIHQWLGSFVLGLPSNTDDSNMAISIDSDGSFPAWYLERYWQASVTKLSHKVRQDLDRVRHLLLLRGGEEDWEIFSPRDDDDDGSTTTTTTSLQQVHDDWFQLHQRMLRQVQETTVDTHFPLEHYAAIFAPLLFPLLIPFLASLVKEWKRFREKKNKKEVEKAENDDDNE